MVAEGVIKKSVVGGCVAVAVVTLTAGIVIWQTHDEKTSTPPIKFAWDSSPSELGVYETAAVSSDAAFCSTIGKEVLVEGGNVVDAGIATLFCMGVVIPQSMGLGGGFLMVLYNATEKKSYVLNAREKAPAGASEDMFGGDSEISQRGGLAVAVPGELKGYWEVYNRFGSGLIPWSRLVQPTINLCKEGILVSRHLANALNQHKERIKNEPSMAEVFINNGTGEVFKQNETFTRPILAQTLERIASEGGNILYNADSELMKSFVKDLKDLGGIIEEQDMIDYYVDWAEPVTMDISESVKIHTVPPPGSGILVTFIMKLLSEYNLRVDGDLNSTVMTYHRIAEAFKHAFAKRTYLGDPDPRVGHPEDVALIQELMTNLTSIDYINSIRSLINDEWTNNTYEYYGAEFYQPEDHGTSHMSILAPNGDAIAVTSTVNLYLGAMIRSRTTGIIYNDEMDDFSAPNITNAFGVPPSPRNFILPGKRPVSSMAPSIFTDPEGRARLILGGAGGTSITTAVAYVSMRTLWFNETIKEAIDARRIHHQLYPMVLDYETDFPEEYVDGLKAKNHTTLLEPLGSSVVVGIARGSNGTIYANSDFRKEGTVAGY